MLTLAYDLKLNRPGCVLIQAAMGGTVDVSRHFDSKDWLLYPTPDMKVYRITEAQLEEAKRATEIFSEVSNEEGID